jgi:hypothetical protein
MSSDEFCDSLHIRYGRTPAGLQPACDGCGASFNTHHAFSCAKGGLVIIRHKELRDALCDMASRAFPPSAVRDEPYIHRCCPTQARQPCTPMAENEDRGDLLIRGLWERGTGCILGVRVTDTDAPTYQMNDPHKVLEAAERLKKKKYLQPCLDQCRHFTPFIVSVGKEANTVLKFLAARTSTKAGNTYEHHGIYEGAPEHSDSQSHPCMPHMPQSPDITNEQHTSTVGGYCRDGPPQILIKRRL